MSFYPTLAGALTVLLCKDGVIPIIHKVHIPNAMSFRALMYHLGKLTRESVRVSVQGYACIGEVQVPMGERVERRLQEATGTCSHLPIVCLEDHDAFCTGINSTWEMLAIFSQPDPCSLGRKQNGIMSSNGILSQTITPQITMTPTDL